MLQENLNTRLTETYLGAFISFLINSGVLDSTWKAAKNLHVFRVTDLTVLLHREPGSKRDCVLYKKKKE